MRVYLAGPINGCTDVECKSWRLEAKEFLTERGHVPVDPMDRDYRGREDGWVNAIVECDKQDIDSADLVLVYSPKPSYGTAMEILYGWSRGKPVLTVLTGPGSPWVSYHSEYVFTNLPAALNYVQELSDYGVHG